jgi:hypothetical protein
MAGRDEFERILEECLDRIISGQESLDSTLSQHPDIVEELRPDLEAALWLDGFKSPLDPRPGFVAASRNRLVSQIQQEMGTQEATTTAGWFAVLWGTFFGRKRSLLQLALVVLLLACVVIGGAGVSVRAQYALPGDNTYAVKLVVEQAELAVTTDPGERAQLHTEFAQNRLDEAQELVMEGRYEFVPDTIGRYEYHVNQAVRSLNQLSRTDRAKAQVLAESLSDTLEVHTASLSVMIAVVPVQYQPDLEWALSISDSSLLLVEKVVVRVGGVPRTAPTRLFIATSTKVPTSTPRPQATVLPTQTTKPTNTAVLIKTATKTITPTSRPWSTSTPTPTLQNTRKPTSNPGTAKPTATNTQRPPTNTPAPATSTPKPPTNTPVQPSNTPRPPTNTPKPPTNTPKPPTNTPKPPTTEPPPPTNPPPTDPPYP